MSLLALMYTASALKKNNDNQNYARVGSLSSKRPLEIRRFSAAYENPTAGSFFLHVDVRMHLHFGRKFIACNFQVTICVQFHVVT